MSEAHHRPAHAAEAHVPHEEFLEGEKLKIVITGLDDMNLRASAAEAADKQLTDKLNENGGGFKGFVKKMWKNAWYGNALRDHYRNKYMNENRQAMIEGNDIEAHLDDDVKDTGLELETTKRWAQAFDENLRQDLLSEEEAETFGLVLDRNPDGSVNREGAELKKDLTELIDDFVEGRIADQDAFNENVKRTLHDAAQSGAHANMIGRAELYATNLFHIAQNVQAMKMRAESEGRAFSVRDTMENAVIIMGSAKVGPETEAHLSRVERTVEKLNKIPILNTVNEATLATAVSVVYSVAGWATKSAVGAAAAVFASGSAAGVWAGFREAHRLKQEKAQHNREYARGEFTTTKTRDAAGNIIDEVFDLNNAEQNLKRREAIDKARYESKSATELMEQLNILYNDEGEFRVHNGDTFREAMQIIAEIEARNRLSSQDKIDLIHFSKGQMSRERRLLRLQLAKAKIDMRHTIEEADDALLTEFGVNPADINDVKSRPDGDVLDFVLNPIRDGNEGVLDVNVIGEINEDIQAKDRLWRRLRIKEVTKAVVKGTVLGITFGTLAQEFIVAPLRGDTQGLLERTLGFDNNTEVTRQTLLDSLVNPDAPVHMSPNYTTIDLPEGNGNKLTLPDNMHVEKTGDNTVSINGEDLKISDLKVNPDGSLPPETQALLHEAGFNVSQEQSFGPPEVTHHEVKSTPHEILKNHKDLTTRVTRDHWYDNDTEMYWKNGKHLGADHNELGLWQPRYQKDGDIIIPTNMKESGSWHNGMSAHWQELARDGKLQIALSLSKGTQHDVFMIPINEDGDAIIKADSPIANFYRPGENPKDAEFMGKFTEVVEVRGEDASGKTHIAPLATDVGPGLKKIPDVITETKPNPITTYSLEYQPNKNLDVAVPPVLPWYPRKGLELIDPRSTHIEAIPTPYYISSYFESGGADTTAHLSRMSPRLRNNDNPDTELNERQEMQWYWDQQSPEHQNRVNGLVNQTAPLGASVKAVVAIPVAGHQESANIYRTLSAYLNQTADKGNFEIVLYVNHPETDPSGNPTSAQDTINEINRFKADHPEMNVQVMYEKLPRSEAKIGVIRKNLNDAIIRRNMQRGGSDELIIISNDADTMSVADTYITNFVEKFEDNKDIDAMLGQLDWDNEAFLHYPEIHIGTRLFLYSSVQYRQFGGGLSSSGGNFALRAKNYAAIGGYNPDAAIGEDIQLGHALAAARKGATNKRAIGFAGNAASRLETSARRSIYVLEHFGDAPINQWDYSFGADDDAVRGGGLSRPQPDFTDAADRAKIIRNVENIVHRSLKVYGRNFTTDADGKIHHNNKYLERSLRLCGLDFEWTDDYKLHITNADRMFDGLIAFRNRHMARASA